MQQQMIYNKKNKIKNFLYQGPSALKVSLVALENIFRYEVYFPTSKRLWNKNKINVWWEETKVFLFYFILFF